MEKPPQIRKRGPLRRSLMACGGLCSSLGIVLLIGVLLGLVSPAAFALGGEAGLRVIGAVAVLGCIMLALGFYDE